MQLKCKRKMNNLIKMFIYIYIWWNAIAEFSYRGREKQQMIDARLASSPLSCTSIESSSVRNVVWWYEGQRKAPITLYVPSYLYIKLAFISWYRYKWIYKWNKRNPHTVSISFTEIFPFNVGAKVKFLTTSDAALIVSFITTQNFQAACNTLPPYIYCYISAPLSYIDTYILLFMMGHPIVFASYYVHLPPYATRIVCGRYIDGSWMRVQGGRTCRRKKRSSRRQRSYKNKNIYIIKIEIKEEEEEDSAEEFGGSAQKRMKMDVDL